MTRPTLHTVLSMAALLIVQMSHAGGPTSTLRLNIDLEVEELSLEEARLILLPQNGEAKLMEGLGGKVELSLELGNAYLIEFQRPGCTSRQLMLDAKVPVDAISNMPMSFNTKMKLEMPPAEQRFEFLGPVGYIYYDKAMGAFRYHQDYKMFGEQAMLDRMVVERVRFAREHSPVILRPERGYITHPGYEYGVHVPTIATAAPMVHLTGVHKFKQPKVHPAVMEQAIFAPAPVPEDLVAAVPLVEELPMVRDFSIQEEMTIDRSRIIKDVRITSEGRTTDFRKVTTHYGAVYYFKNGISCSEHTYLSGIDISVLPAQVR